MKIKAIYKSPNLACNHYKHGKKYSLDFNIVSRSFGSINSCIEIQKCEDFEGKSIKKYSSLKEFLNHWTII